MGEERKWIVPGKNRRLVVPRGEDKRVKFGKARRQWFLEHLAATCNVTASAAAAEVSLSAVYRCRMRDADFRADWELALEQGYARLEAALLERATRGEGRVEVRGDLPVEGPDAPDEIDWKKGMQLLDIYERRRAGRAVGPRRAPPRRVAIEELAATLIRRMKALGVRPPEEGAD